MFLNLTTNKLLILPLICGITLVGLGCTVMTGWHLHSTTLIQIYPSFAPMQYNTALCFLFGGFSLILIATQYSRVSLLSSSIIASVGFLTIAEYVCSIDLGIDQLLMNGYVLVQVSHPGRMAPNTSFCFALGGLALILSGAFRAKWWGLTSGRLLALIVLVTGSVTLTGLIIGFRGIFAWGNLTSMSVHASIGFILLGTGIILINRDSEQQSEKSKFNWVPIYTGVSVATASLIIWQALLTQQSDILEMENRAAAASIKTLINTKLNDRYNSLFRMAKRWENKVYYKQEIWDSDATFYVAGYNDYQAIEWVDSSYHIRWLQPLSGNEKAVNFNLADIESRKNVLDKIRQTRQSAMTPLLDLIKGGKGYLFIIPVFKDSEFDGFVIGVFGIDKIFDKALSEEHLRNYSLVIKLNNEEIFRHNADFEQYAGISTVEKINFLEQNWELTVRPTFSNPIGKSILPHILLGLGLLLSGLIVFAGNLASTARKNASLTKRVNRELEAEISKREGIQNDLQKMTAIQQAILDSADYMIISTLVDGTIQTFNRGAEEMLGYRADEVINKVTPAIIHDPNEIVAQAEKLSRELGKKIEPGFEVFVCKAREGRIDENEWTYIRKDGSSFPVSLSATALRDAGGQVNGFLGVGKDITTLKRAEELFQKEKLILEMIARNELHSILLEEIAGVFENRADGISSSIFWVDKRNLRYYASFNLPAAFYKRIEGLWLDAKIGPFGAAASLNQPVFISDFKTDRRWENFNKLALENNLRSCWAIPIIGQNDEILAVFAIYKPIVSEPNEFEKLLIERFSKLIGIAIEKHLVEVAMKESEATIRSFYESASMLMGVVEVIGDDIVHISDNPATARFMGVEPEELRNRLSSSLGVPQELLDIWIDKYGKSRETGQPVTFVYEHQTPTAKRWLSATVSYIGQNRVDRSRFSYVIQDITEQKLDESRIKQSLIEKESLLKEIHHRVKNNLQVISSLFSLQSNYISDPQTLAVFGESRQRVHSMALIHEKLYRDTDLAKIDFAEYVNDLGANLFSSYLVGPETIKLRIEVEELFLNIQYAIPCGLIINELISNAIKYAFPDPDETENNEIRICLRAVNADFYLLSVSDSGIGLPKDFDIENSESLGLRLVSILTRQLNATLEIINDDGAEFKILFPIADC